MSRPDPYAPPRGTPGYYIQLLGSAMPAGPYAVLALVQAEAAITTGDPEALARAVRRLGLRVVRALVGARDDLPADTRTERLNALTPIRH